MSGSSQNANINIAITANSAQLVTAVQQAMQAINGAGATINNFNGTMGTFTASTEKASTATVALNASVATLNTTASRASTSLNQAAGAAVSAASGLNTVSSAARQTEQNVGQASERVAAMGRRMINMSTDVLQGQFSQIPGSFMILAERIGGVNMALTATLTALGLATISAFHFVEALGKIADARRGIEASGAMFNPELNTEALNKYFDQLRRMNGWTTEAAGEVVSTFTSMRGANMETIKALAGQVELFAQATGQKLPKAAQDIKTAFESPSASGRKFLEDINASEDAIKAFDDATGDTAVAERRKIMLQQLALGTERVTQSASNAAKAMARYDTTVAGTGYEGAVTPADLEAARATGRAAAEAEMTERRRVVAAALASMSNNEKSNEAGQTWFQKQQEGATELRSSIIASAGDYKTARLTADKQLAEYWRNVSAQAVAGSKDQKRAHEEYLRYKEQADMGSLRLGETNRKADVDAQVAALGVKQAANKDDFDLVMSLEKEKLDLLAAQYGIGSTQYQNELKHKVELERAHQQELVRVALEGVKMRERLDADILNGKSRTLNAEVDANRMSRDEAITELQRLVTANRDAQLAMLADVTKNLTEGTAQWIAAQNMRASITSRAQASLAGLEAQATSASAKSAQTAANSFVSAFANMDRMAASTFTGLVTHTTTWQQAAGRMLTALIQDFLATTLSISGRWIATEIAMTQASTVQNAVRKAQDAGGTGFAAMLSARLGEWLGFETSKTSITVASGQAQVAATAAAETEKTAITTVASLETKAVTALTTKSTIGAHAAEAAAGAYAAIAQIPYVGPVLAPAAAAVAFAGVMAYDTLIGLDVGAWNVPQDMPAYIHKGEMVVPADFASGIRSGLTGSGQTNSRGGVTYSPIIQANGSGVTQGEVSRLLNRSKKEVQSYLWQMSRNGGLGLPGRAT